jgi:transposase-like protein
MSSPTHSPSTTDRWSPLVSDLGRSGLPVRAFTASVNVNPSTLTWWRSQLRRGAAQRPPLEAASGPPATAFVALVVCSPRTSPPSLRVCLRDNRVPIDVVPGADLSWLHEVVEELC